MVALYHATNGANWLSEEPIGAWYGVTTDEIGRVTRMNLYNNDLDDLGLPFCQ